MKYKINTKEHYIQDRLKYKKIFCISKKWVKWAKKYTNRASRRKENMKEYEEE